MAWLDSAFLYRKKITISASIVNGSVDLTDFKYPFVRTDADFSKARSDGNDFVFTTIDGITELSHELVSFTANKLISHVKIPSISATSDTEIYVYYGNASVPPELMF